MQSGQLRITPGLIMRVLLFIVIVPFLPVLVSGRWGWWEAWVYGGLIVVGFVVSRALAARKNPDLLVERARFMDQQDAKPWDRVLAPLVGIGAILMPLAAGLEERWAPTPAFGRAGVAAGLVLLLAGYAFSSWALVENRFFSGVVRIQADRGQHVVSSGPYARVRHPGYAGALLVYLGTPLFLDSRWAVLPLVFFCVVVVVRTALEDRTLQEELPGYREYAQRVRYRLVPGIW